MTRLVLILFVIVLAVFIGLHVREKSRSRRAAALQSALSPSSAHAASVRRVSGSTPEDPLVELRREVKSLKAAGTAPGDSVVKSLDLITAKLSEIEQRLRALEQRAAREDYRQKMLDKR